ncbi:hypothetical protein HYU22_04120 [Candidatus Woesearchaeota archaeon]|nr:hypothetical protein [Candidatus Woesearchaeota archaeon]
MVDASPSPTFVLEELVADRAGIFHKRMGYAVTVCPVSPPVLVPLKQGRLTHDSERLEQLFSAYEDDRLPGRGYVAGPHALVGPFGQREALVQYYRYRVGVLSPEFDLPERYVGATISFRGKTGEKY